MEQRTEVCIYCSGLGTRHYSTTHSFRDDWCYECQTTGFVSKETRQKQIAKISQLLANHIAEREQANGVLSK